MSQAPWPSILRALEGTGQARRVPAQAMRPARTTTTALATGRAPVPSSRVAPTIARATCPPSGVGAAASSNDATTATPLIEGIESPGECPESHRPTIAHAGLRHGRPSARGHRPQRSPAARMRLLGQWRREAAGNAPACGGYPLRAHSVRALAHRCPSGESSADCSARRDLLRGRSAIALSVVRGARPQAAMVGVSARSGYPPQAGGLSRCRSVQ